MEMRRKAVLIRGMRVKDTARKLVQKGKFMGGAAPYGYRLVLSGEISKHGRALHHLEILPDQAEMVRHIFRLSLYKEFGSAKIARLCNEQEDQRRLAPGDAWKSGTITSILTNPIYTGHTAYKRRERIQGKYHRARAEDWILSTKRMKRSRSSTGRPGKVYRRKEHREEKNTAARLREREKSRS